MYHTFNSSVNLRIFVHNYMQISFYLSLISVSASQSLPPSIFTGRHSFAKLMQSQPFLTRTRSYSLTQCSDSHTFIRIVSLLVIDPEAF